MEGICFEKLWEAKLPGPANPSIWDTFGHMLKSLTWVV
jgi:hypothetical protein